MISTTTPLECIAVVQARLLNSSPEYIYDYFKLCAENPAANHHFLLQKIEEDLVARQSLVINLAVAQFGTSLNAVRSLFRSAPENSAIRVAVLYNRTLARELNSGLQHPFPQALFADRGEVCRFLTAAPSDEIQAMFLNPALDNNFFADLFARKPPFNDLDEERWREIIAKASWNPRLLDVYESKHSGHGMADHMHTRVANEAWTLTAFAPVSEVWARTLVSLLSRTRSESYFLKEPAAIAARWCGERVDNDLEKSGYLDSFGEVRRLIGKCMIDRHQTRASLLISPDVAFRCAVYRYGAMSPTEMQVAFEKEPFFFCNNALENDLIWKTAQTRELLNHFCYQLADAREHDPGFYTDVYRLRSEERKQTHPEWFEEMSDENSEPLDDLDRVVAFPCPHCKRAIAISPQSVPSGKKKWRKWFGS